MHWFLGFCFRFFLEGHVFAVVFTVVFFFFFLHFDFCFCIFCLFWHIVFFAFVLAFVMVSLGFLDHFSHTGKTRMNARLFFSDLGGRNLHLPPFATIFSCLPVSSGVFQSKYRLGTKTRTKTHKKKNTLYNENQMF